MRGKREGWGRVKKIPHVNRDKSWVNKREGCTYHLFVWWLRGGCGWKSRRKIMSFFIFEFVFCPHIVSHRKKGFILRFQSFDPSLFSSHVGWPVVAIYVRLGRDSYSTIWTLFVYMDACQLAYKSEGISSLVHCLSSHMNLLWRVTFWQS